MNNKIIISIGLLSISPLYGAATASKYEQYKRILSYKEHAISLFGLMTRQVPALEEQIAETIAKECLERNPLATKAEILAFYSEPSQSVRTFSPTVLLKAHELLQELKRGFLFLVNTTACPLDLRFGIDPNPAHALPPRRLKESTAGSLEPGAAISNFVTIRGNGIVRLCWQHRILGDTSYILIIPIKSQAWSKHGFYSKNAPKRIVPGSTLYLDENGNIVREVEP